MTSSATHDMTRTAKRLWGYVRPHQWSAALSLVAFFLASATEPLVPALLKEVLDQGFLAQPRFPLWLVPVAFVGLFVTRGLLAFSGTYLLNRAATRTVLGIRTALVRAVLRADANLYSQMNPGTTVARVVNNPQDVTTLMGGAVATVFNDGTTTIAMLAYLFYLNWQLTLLALVALPVSGLVARRIHRRVMALGTQAYESQMRLVSVVDDITRAWRVVRTFDAGDWERERFVAEAKRLQRATIKSVATSALMSPASQAVASIGLALILTFGLYKAHQDGSTVGTFVAYITAMLLLVSRVKRLTDVSQPLVSGLIVARGCFELLDAPEEPDDGTRELETCRGEIRFDRVDIRYPGGDKPALTGLCLEALPGQSIALVGASGAGKTTVVSALLGFVKPERGRILLDGIDIAELRKSSLRRQFAVVSQDVVLFEGSLASNVAYAQPRDDQRIAQCLMDANLHEFVRSQPDGIHTDIGVNGSRLSGGQRQRVAIARALYKNAPILILDEATSALDSESERLVQDALQRVMRGRTSIVIAHRFSTIDRADRVVAVDAGRVVEEGTHADLLARGGLYARLHALQTGG